MNNEPALALCPRCGKPIPAGATQGVCPSCALAAAAAPGETDQPAGSVPPPPSLETVAAAFPQLHILGLIGVGGMGAVYKARQPKLDRLVALKLLTQSLAADRGFTERFHREARLLARLNHPGIVSVYDYGESGGFFYLLMEFVDGVNLRQAMRAERFTPAQALALVPRICEALQFAHEEGVLHRDIKPENILLDTRGRLKIADFGVAKLIGERRQGATLTDSGLVLGTLHYMAPEQFEHPHDVDRRADIYSLGVVFYEMLTGELPLGRFAPPSQKTPVDPRVDEVVLRALERERERRQHDAAEVKTEVEQITATPAGAAGAMAPAAVPATPRTSLCYVSTPEYLRTIRGRFLYIYQGKGRLRLDPTTLGFISGWQVVTIPLTAIRALALGDYPVSGKPVSLQYLGVTFEEHGLMRTLLFTPTRNALLPVWETNKVVAEWLDALRQAVRDATGRTLAVDRSAADRELAWGELAKAFLLTAVLCSLAFAVIPLIAEQRLPNRLSDYLPGFVLAALTLGVGLVLRWWRRRSALRDGNLDRLTSGPSESGAPGVGPSGTAVLPPGPLSQPHPGSLPGAVWPVSSNRAKSRRPISWTISAWVFVAIGILAAIDTLASLYARPLNLTVSPCLAHLFAGVALLTLSRRWRVAALVALGLAVAAGLFIGIAMAVAPEHGSVNLPMLDLRIAVLERPYLGAVAAVFLASMFTWPCYLLLCSRGRRLFASPAGRAATPAASPGAP